MKFVNPSLMLGQLLIREGGICFVSQRYSDTIDYFIEAVGLFPDEADSYLARAFCNTKLKNLPQVEVDALRAMELNPNEPKCYMFLGIALSKRNAHAEGMIELERV